MEWIAAGPLMVIDALVAGLLLRSLLPGRTPLITRIAILARGDPLPPEVVRYTRRVTQLWLIVFAGLAAVIGAALIGLLPQGASLSGVLGQGPVCLAVLLLEYGFRRWHLRNLSHPGLLAFLGFLRRVDYRMLLRP